MENNFVSIFRDSKNCVVESINDGRLYNIPASLVSTVADYTETEEASIQLFTYFSERLSSYLDTLGMDKYVNEKNVVIYEEAETMEKVGELFTASMIASILIELLKRLPEELVIEALDLIQDSDLFSGPAMLEDVTKDDIIDYLVGIVEDRLDLRRKEYDEGIEQVSLRRELVQAFEGFHIESEE